MPDPGDDKFLEQIRRICRPLPEFQEVEAWGHPTFRAGKKMFAACGYEEPNGARSLGLRVGPERQDELLRDSRFFPTPYAAHLGWVSLRLDANIDWEEVAVLLREAYRSVALQRMLRAQEESTGELPAKPSRPAKKRTKRN